ILSSEGTRAPTDDALLPFKKGGFMLALETEFPIVPIAVRGSRSLLPKGSWRVAGGEIDVVVGSPIPVAGARREELMERVRGFIAEQLGIAEPAGIAAVRAEAV